MDYNNQHKKEIKNPDQEDNREKILGQIAGQNKWQAKCGPCADSCTSGDRCA